jgi:hypothetical protein
MFLVIANPVVIRFSLPESLTRLSKKFIRFAGCKPFPTLDNRTQGFIRHGPEDDVNMVWHHDPRVKVVAGAMKKTQRSNNDIRNFGSSKPAFAAVGVKKVFQFPKIIAFDLFNRIIRRSELALFALIRRWGVEPMKSFGTLGLIFQQHVFRQRIHESKGNKIARALAFDVRKKAARMNSRPKRICRLRFNSGGTKFKFYAIKPWIFLGGNHGRRLRRRVVRRQWRGFAECAALGDSVPSNCSRSAECNSAIQQIENLRYIAGAMARRHRNRTNFLQRFYKLDQ